jgi:hypothetical protein
MTSGGKTAVQALSESPIAGLVDQARKLGRISSLVADFSRDCAGGDPALPPRCAIQGRQVIILVATSSQAAKLRQRTTTLTRLLQDCEPDLTGFRIRLQPGGSDDPAEAVAIPPKREPPTPETVSAALRFAEDLGRQLHPSPLRDAALRLRSTLRNRMKSERS